MAHRKEPIWATVFNGDKTETVNTNPLKVTDCEDWNASDHKKALILLSQHFPDAPVSIDIVKAMTQLLREKIGQDWKSIEATVTAYYLKEK